MKADSSCSIRPVIRAEIRFLAKIRRRNRLLAAFTQTTVVRLFGHYTLV
jgi:hypothetical protein